MSRTDKKTHRMEELSDEVQGTLKWLRRTQRLLEELGIKYESREYELDPDDLSAEKVADKIGFPPEQLFKTLVAMGDRHGICIAVIPADTELDLKTLAAASGNRKIQQEIVSSLRGQQH